MKRFAVVMLMLGVANCLWATPTQITYQGTLKEGGVPASGSKSMKFEVLSNGQSVWTQQTTVTVVNGLFSVVLTPTNIDWANLVNPQLQVTINNQVLTPPETIAASPYSIVANAVVDGAIGPTKIASGYGLVPSGAILMFDGNCPSGFTRYAALDNRFPMGADPSVTAPGTTGGSATHSHTISMDGAHTHNLATSGTIAYGGPIGVGVDNGATAGQILALANSGGRTGNLLQNVTTNTGAHNHGGSTGTAISLPPYLTFTYCQKQ